MSLYDVAKLMTEARRLAANYYKATGQTLPLTNEIARFDAQRLLDLAPVQEEIAGVDAIGCGARKGQKIQIKGRVQFEGSKAKQRIGQLSMDGKWDSVVLVLMDENYNAVELVEVQRTDIESALVGVAQNKRGAMTVGKFKSLGKVVWTEQSVQTRQNGD
jgi:hypothetical protein